MSDHLALLAQTERDAVTISDLRLRLAQQSAMTERCIEAMNANADRGEAAEKMIRELTAELEMARMKSYLAQISDVAKERDEVKAAAKLALNLGLSIPAKNPAEILNTDSRAIADEIREMI